MSKNSDNLATARRQTILATVAIICATMLIMFGLFVLLVEVNVRGGWTSMGVALSIFLLLGCGRWLGRHR
jgi:hypothetical protein